jgi:hypothetical protein
MCFWSDWSTNSRGREVELKELFICNKFMYFDQSTHISTVLLCIPLLIIIAGRGAKAER